MADDHLVSLCKVTIDRKNGEWTVDVCGGLGGSGAKTFAIEEYARNFAAGQRIRLGLENAEQPFSPSRPSNFLKAKGAASGPASMSEQ
jgi:hypothetical protein